MAVNDVIADKLTELEVLQRRLTGDAQNRVDKRLTKLQQDIKARMQRVDPWSAQQKAAKDRRATRLLKEVDELIAVAFREIGLMLQSDVKRHAQVESKSVVNALREAIP
jgi:hypothetical protein